MCAPTARTATLGSPTLPAARWTINKAIDVVATLDISIYNVTIQVGAGTYSATVNVNKPWVGSGTVTLSGDTSTPSNVIIAGGGGQAVLVSGTGVRISIQGFRLTGGYGLQCQYGANLTVTGAMNYAATLYQVFATGLGFIAMNGVAATISAGAVAHYYVSAGGLIETFNTAWTLSGTPTFSSAFASVAGGQINTVGNTTSSGSATGSRYNATLNGVINTNGGGASLFPGSTAGSTATGGQYA